MNIHEAYKRAKLEEAARLASELSLADQVQGRGEKSRITKRCELEAERRAASLERAYRFAMEVET